MKRLVLLGILLLVSPRSYALMVYDPKAIATAIQHHGELEKHWKEELDHCQKMMHNVTQQSDMLKEQLMGLTRLRDIGDLEGQLSLLTDEIQGIERKRAMLNGMLSSANPSLSSEANSILAKYQMFDVCKDKGNQRLSNICKEEILNKAGTIEIGDQIKEKMNRKVKEAQVLARKAANSKDLKESQDIANAIALKDLEITQLQNQWRNSVDESSLREKLIEQKRITAFNEHQRNAPIPKFDPNDFK